MSKRAKIEKIEREIKELEAKREKAKTHEEFSDLEIQITDLYELLEALR
jgi:hypothetical protein